MKLKALFLAVAAATAAPATFALTPSQVDANTVRLWVSGASAPTATVYKGFLTLCAGMEYKDAKGEVHLNPGSRDATLYLERTSGLPGTAGDRMAYACTVQTDDNRAGSLEGRKVIIYHTVEGGSFNAYAPHLRIAGDTNPNLPTSLQRIQNIEALGANGCSVGPVNETVDVSGKPNAVRVYRGCARTTVNFTQGQSQRASVTAAPDRPEGGFSDTEYLINKLNLDIATELSDIGNEVPTNIGQAFGVAVSYPLYYQLQKNDIAAGMIPDTCDDAPHSASNPNLTAQCQPSLPAQKYTAVAAADYIGGVSAKTFGAASATPPGTSGKIQLHRRVITSGTQSASNLRFLNKPCASGAPQGALEPARAGVHDVGTNVKITENASTGGVRTGLTNASNNGEFGLGVVSMENAPGSDKFAYVKLNGVSPNSDAMRRANAMNGNYDFWYELVAFTAHTAFDEGRDLMNALTTSLGDPGITDLPGLFITPMAGVTGGNNVGSGARVANSCRPIVQ